MAILSTQSLRYSCFQYSLGQEYSGASGGMPGLFKHIAFGRGYECNANACQK